jgi:hypothetical protein
MDLDGILVEFEVELFDSVIRWLPENGGEVFVWEVIRDLGRIGGGHFCCNCLTARWRGYRKKGGLFLLQLPNREVEALPNKMGVFSEVTND